MKQNNVIINIYTTTATSNNNKVHPAVGDVPALRAGALLHEPGCRRGPGITIISVIVIVIMITLYIYIYILLLLLLLLLVVVVKVV